MKTSRERQRQGIGRASSRLRSTALAKRHGKPRAIRRRHFHSGAGTVPIRPIRVGWIAEPGFGAIDSDVTATVKATAEALKNAGVTVEEVRIPALEQINALELLWKLQAMKTKPAFRKAKAGHENLIHKHVQSVFDAPDTSIEDFVMAEQQIETMRDGLAQYVSRYDALLCPVMPALAHAHDAAESIFNGKTISTF